MRQARHHRRRGIAVLFLGVATGCNSLNWSFHSDKPTEKPPTLNALPVDKPPATPSRFARQLGQFTFYHDFALDAQHPLFAELSELRRQVCKELALPESSTPVQVFLFEDRERYERFMKSRYPDLPRRRAFFIAQPRSLGGGDDLLVYTFWGEEIRQDLRHELTHAVLHSVLKDVPLWLDEGLAEYFELPPTQHGVNVTHLDHLRRTGAGDLNRLEQLSQVAQMEKPQYREAWAWVHLMLHGKPEGKAVLLAYLQKLRLTPNAGLLGPQLAEVYPKPIAALTEHLEQLGRTQAARRP